MTIAEGVLPAGSAGGVPLIRAVDRRADLPHGAGEIGVDRNRSQRRTIVRALVNRRSLEEDRVRGGDDHDRLELQPFEQLESLGRHATRIGIAGVRHNERYRVAVERDLVHLGEIAGDGLGQLAGMGGVEQTGYCGFSIVQ